jgi:hypothetical protein
MYLIFEHGKKVPGCDPGGHKLLPVIRKERLFGTRQQIIIQHTVAEQEKDA